MRPSFVFDRGRTNSDLVPIEVEKAKFLPDMITYDAEILGRLVTRFTDLYVRLVCAGPESIPISRRRMPSTKNHGSLHGGKLITEFMDFRNGSIPACETKSQGLVRRKYSWPWIFASGDKNHSPSLCNIAANGYVATERLEPWNDATSMVNG